MPDQQYVTFSAAWFTLSLINAGLAQTKGRSGGTWWLLSLLLGPFATFLIVAGPAVTPKEPAPGVMNPTRATIIGLAAVMAILATVGLIVLFTGGGR